MKNIMKQFVLLVLIDVIIVGFLSFGLETYLLSFLGTMVWWQYLILLAILMLITVPIWLAISFITKHRQKKNIVAYLQKLIAQREANSKEYLPLSYKIDNETVQRYSLEELVPLSAPKKGFVLYANGGYGKTWSIGELAGRYAKQALRQKNSETTPMPILINVGELKDKDCSIAQIIKKELFSKEEDGLEKATDLLMKGYVMLFVDGMDEAGVDVQESVSTELETYMKSALHLTIIGGTREEALCYFPSSLSKFSICTLIDEQVKAYIDKVISDEETNKRAKFYYFENPKTNFLRELRTPFYLKTFVEFLKYDGQEPKSAREMLKNFVKELILRERDKKKGFRAQVATVEEFLTLLSGYLGTQRSAEKNAALKYIKEELVYDYEKEGSVAFIADRLDAMGILRIVTAHGGEQRLIKFSHPNYQDCYQKEASGTDMLNY